MASKSEKFVKAVIEKKPANEIKQELKKILKEKVIERIKESRGE